MNARQIAGYTLTDRQLAALHGLYKGLVTGGGTVYGVNARKALNSLAEDGIIARSAGAYVIPWGSPGEAIINATPGFVISEHL